MSAVLATHNGHVALRIMRESDLAAVHAIESRAYSYPWTQAIFGDCLRVGYACSVAEEHGLVAGYSVLALGPGEAHLLNLVVDPDRQGCGIGARLLHRATEVARWHRCESVFLEVRPSNRAAVALYRKAGFVEAGMRPGYYPAEGGREDALIMAVELSRTKDARGS